jgi:SAM-dependent methyltransferase
VTQPDGVIHTFTAHNIALPGDVQTRPGTELTAGNGICRSALRDLRLAFPGVRPWLVRIADLGCLEGGYAAAFAQAGYEVTGFEARRENILCCEYVAEQLNLPNLRFVQADVRDVFGAGNEWDAVFCCGLLYHLDNPVALLNQIGQSACRLLIVQTHYSTRPDAEHEGHRGHWYSEGRGRWESWQNERSFWLTRKDLMAAIRDAGFDLVFEQADWRPDILADDLTLPDARGMFIGIKIP